MLIEKSAKLPIFRNGVIFIFYFTCNIHKLHICYKLFNYLNYKLKNYLKFIKFVKTQKKVSFK